jgi:hypothetical protein
MFASKELFVKSTRAWRCLALSIFLASSGLAQADPAPAAAPLQLDGITIDDSATVDGVKLVLNGAAIQKRGFFKTNTIALYLPEKSDTRVGVLRQPGPKHLRIVVLRDIAGWLIARQTLSDFAANTTDDEARVLSDEVNAVAANYTKLGVVHKGDVMVADWVPGQGIVSTLNGQSMGPPLNDPLLFDVSLRAVIGESAPSDLREQLLGIRQP